MCALQKLAALSLIIDLLVDRNLDHLINHAPFAGIDDG